MAYPQKASFYHVSYSDNGYGEPEEAITELVTTGARIVTERFRDQLQGQVNLSGERQYVYVRKSPKTLQVKAGDRVRLKGLNQKNYKVIAVDAMLANRFELLFLIDAES